MPTNGRENFNGLLKGITILDFTKLLPGPLATMLLGEQGARIIKIESPTSPDPTRFYPPIVGEWGANFEAVNRHKEFLTLDYRTEAGQAHFFELLKNADVVVEQFRPEAMSAWGLGYEDLKKHKPDIIYASITGYGQDGESATKAGHDLNYLATSGILSLCVDNQGTPIVPGIQIADVAGGSMQAVNHILAALLQKSRTGEGCYLDINMTKGLEPFMLLNRAQIRAGEKLSENRKTYLSGRLPNYDVYRCKDGLFVALGALEPKFWANFCHWSQHPEWENLYFPTDENVAFLKRELSAFFLTKTRNEWVEMATGFDICLSSVVNFEDEIL